MMYLKAMLSLLVRSYIREPSKVILVIAINILGVLCVINSEKDFLKTSQEIASLQAVFNQQWLDQGEKNPHAAAHFGIWVLKPVTSLHYLESGYTKYMGSAIWLEAHKQNLSKYIPVSDNIFLERLIRLDVSSMLQIFIPLYILLMSFSLFSSDRENQTLSLMLGMGIPPRRIVLSKLAAQSIVITLGLLPFVIYHLMVWVKLMDMDSATHGDRLSMIFSVYVLYYLFFLVLVSSASMWLKKSATSLLVCFTGWVLITLVIPKITMQTASLAFPLPSPEVFLDGINQDIEHGMNGDPGYTERQKILEKTTLEKYGVSTLDSLPVNYAGVALQAGEEYGYKVYEKHFEDLDRLIHQQDRLNLVIGAICPIIPMRNLVTFLAGTDAWHHHEFSVQAEYKRREMNKLMNDQIMNSKRSQDRTSTADYQLYTALDSFTFRLPPLWLIVHVKFVPVIMLGLQLLVLLFGLRLAANKYVRYD